MTWLDRIPRREIRLGGSIVASWRIAAAVGCVAALITGLGLGVLSGMPLTLVAGAGVASLAAHLLMQAVSNWRRGKEEHVLLEALLLSIGVTFAVYQLVGADPLRGLDIHIVGFSVLMVAGRAGCFLHGCCHGVPSEWGVAYGHSHPSGRPVRRRAPVQLFESVLWLLLSLWGLVLTLVAHPGRATGAILAAYAVGRFGLEGLRGDARRFWGGVSQSRWMCAPVFVLGLALADRGSGSSIVVVGFVTCLVVGILVVTRHRWLPPSGPLPLAELEKLGQALRAGLAEGDSRELRLGAWLTVASRGPTGWLLRVEAGEPPMRSVEATLCLEALAIGLGLPILDLRPTPAGNGRWVVRIALPSAKQPPPGDARSDHG